MPYDTKFDSQRFWNARAAAYNAKEPDRLGANVAWERELNNALSAVPSTVLDVVRTRGSLVQELRTNGRWESRFYAIVTRKPPAADRVTG